MSFPSMTMRHQGAQLTSSVPGAAATGGASAANRETLTQRVESVGTLAGQTATVSFWAKRTAGSGDVSVSMRQNFGSGGSSDVYSGATKLTLTTSWQRFSVSVAVPSISGKTVGAGDSLDLIFWFSAGSDWNSASATIGVQTVTAQIVDVVVEPGSASSAFVARPMQTELGLCLRYFETSNPTGLYQSFTYEDGIAEHMGHPTALYTWRIQFRVPKRGAPTVTTYDAAGTSNRYSYNDGTWKNGGTWGGGPTAVQGGFFVYHGTASSVVTEFGWQASAEI
jgi:hypothetical protein